MIATPFWFGPTERPLFGWLHRPVGGAARGGVVICPPLGIEAICVYFSTRTLADRLADAGIAVLRFDYDGTGDSFGGQEDAGRTPAWLASVTAALDALRETGVGPVGLVGIRMGALLAATIAEHDRDLAALVLWDPCISGRSFLREQRAFRLLSIGGDDADRAVDAPGMRFDAETVDGMEELDLLDPAGRWPRGCSCSRTPSDPGAGAWPGGSATPAWNGWRPPARPRSWTRPARSLPTPSSTGYAIGWPRSWTARPRPCGSRPQAWRSWAHGIGRGDRRTPGGARRGRPLRNCRRTGRAGGRPHGGVRQRRQQPHIGQSRLWVELGRSWAASGLRVLRFDLSGNGDRRRPGRPGHLARAPEAFDDVVDACEAISPDDPSDVVLVGLCSGAYQAVEHALVHPTRGVCLINPALSFPSLPDEAPTSAARPGRGPAPGSRPGPAGAAVGVGAGISARYAPLGASPGGGVVASVGGVPPLPRSPVGLWRSTACCSTPGRGDPGAARPAGTRGDGDLRAGGPRPARPRGAGDLPAPRAGQGFHLQVINGLDHAGLMFEERQRLKEALSEQSDATSWPGWSRGRPPVARGHPLEQGPAKV